MALDSGASFPNARCVRERSYYWKYDLIMRLREASFNTMTWSRRNAPLTGQMAKFARLSHLAKLHRFLRAAGGHPWRSRSCCARFH